MIQSEKLTLFVFSAPLSPDSGENADFELDASESAGLDVWCAPKLTVARAPSEACLETLSPHKSGQRCAATATGTRILSEKPSTFDGGTLVRW